LERNVINLNRNGLWIVIIISCPRDFLLQDVLVLLDLLGAPDPNFYNYFKNTEKWYSLLISIEKKLAQMKKLESYSYNKPEQRYFQPYSFESHIEDDHIPFLRRSEYCIAL